MIKFLERYEDFGISGMAQETEKYQAWVKGTGTYVLFNDAMRLVDLLRAMTEGDDSECVLDHHGDCQTHYGEIDGECVIPMVREILKKVPPRAELEVRGVAPGGTLFYWVSNGVSRTPGTSTFQVGGSGPPVFKLRLPCFRNDGCQVHVIHTHDDYEDHEQVMDVTADKMTMVIEGLKRKE